MSPVEMWGIPSRSATRPAWVPLPAPGGPMHNSFMWSSAFRLRSNGSGEDPLVVAHGELRLDLLHGLEGNTHHDEDRDAGEGDRDVPDDPPDDRQHGDEAQEHGTREGDPVEDVGEVLFGLAPRADAGDEPEIGRASCRGRGWCTGRG